ncbi:15664_t:CDS:1 [Racocetra fulgida]|uniref:15664_t:CDS:1 n=1 Tax=Racocetra fulgida TaxID=60492 RepID=A0A9N9BN31_9GLOM|nr:15664_t:CDS:1 [Racocetra fulgida]
MVHKKDKKDKTTQNGAVKEALKFIKDSLNDPKPSSKRSIARDFGIPESTLRHAILNSGPLNCPEPNKVLTDHEEEQLVGYCLNMQRIGFGLSKSGVNFCVLKIICKNGHPHSFNESGPDQS